MKHVLAELAATKSLCQVLVDRQAAFEQAVGQQLSRMMVCLDELLVFTAGPIMPSPVDVLASPQITDSTPTTKSVMSSSPSHASSQGFVLATSCSGSHPTHTANKDNVVPPSSTPIRSVLKSNSGNQVHPALSEQVINRVRLNSCSRENFAANLTRELFTDEERMNSNVSGKCGKEKLNKDLVQVIYDVVFREYPVGTSEKSERCWAKCIRAIDAANRKLALVKRKQSQSEQDKEN